MSERGNTAASKEMIAKVRKVSRAEQTRAGQSRSEQRRKMTGVEQGRW
jgi:hypothetical protein